MINDVIYIISSFLFVFIIKEFMGIFFVKRNMPCIMSIFIWCFFYIIQAIENHYISTPAYHVAIEIGSSLILCMILYEGSFRRKLFWNFIINLLGMIAELLVGYIFMYMNINYIQQNDLGSFTSKIILLMFIFYIRFLNNSWLKREVPLGYWCLLFLIPVGCIFVLNTIFSLCEFVSDRVLIICSMLSSVFILLICFIIFRLYEYIADRLEIQKQQIIFEKQVELCKNQIHEREESNLNIRNMKHDMENHLICVKEYINRKELGLAQSYIDKLLTGDNYFRESLCIESGHIVIDALLNYKIHIMQKYGIKMISHLEIPSVIPFNDADICVILGNCLDNSIEAVNQMDGSNNKLINVEIIFRKDCLLIRITNPFSGNIKKDKQGNYISTKIDNLNHGIGLNSVNKATKKYKGIVTINTKNNIFSIQILLYSNP